MKKLFASVVLLALASCNTPIDRMALCIKAERAFFADVEFMIEMDPAAREWDWPESKRRELREYVTNISLMANEPDVQEVIINQCRVALPYGIVGAMAATSESEPVSKMDIEIWRCVERNSTARAMRDCNNSVKAKYFE